MDSTPPDSADWNEVYPVTAVPNRSPRWQRSTKQIVLIVLTIVLLVTVYFMKNLVAPILFAVILTYLNQPIVNLFSQKLKIPWRISVVIVYLLILAIVIGLIAWGGIALFAQTQNLVTVVTKSVEGFPSMLNEFFDVEASQTSLRYNLGQFFQSDAGTQLTNSFQGILTAITGSLGNVVSGFASKLGWAFFVFGLSFFLILESNQIKGKSINPIVEGYDYDVVKGKQQIARIWNSFLRGQVILMIFTILLYYIVFAILGLNYSFALSLLVGVARLVPYVGSTFAFAAYGLVAYFQGHTIFGMGPLNYAIMIVLVGFIIDKVMDGVLTPKIMADTLRIHPAAVLIAAIVCSRFLGFLGIFLAAPITATLKLLMNYLMNKLEDQDPWKNIETVPKPVPLKTLLTENFNKLSVYLSIVYQFIKKWTILFIRQMRIWIAALREKPAVKNIIRKVKREK